MSETKFTERKYLKSRGVVLHTFEEVYTTPLNELYQTTAVVIKTDTGKVGVGTSTCSPDENFDANKGLKRARDRAITDLIEDGNYYGENENLSNIAKAEAEDAREVAIEKKAEWLNRKFEKMEKQMKDLASKNGFDVVRQTEERLPQLPPSVASLFSLFDTVGGILPNQPLSHQLSDFFERRSVDNKPELGNVIDFDEQW